MAYDFKKDSREFYMPKSVAVMDEFLEANGYANDMNAKRLHHEIYLSDARKVPADKWKTIIRHPIKEAK